MRDDTPTPEIPVQPDQPTKLLTDTGMLELMVDFTQANLVEDREKFRRHLPSPQAPQDVLNLIR